MFKDKNNYYIFILFKKFSTENHHENLCNKQLSLKFIVDIQ